MTDRLGGVSRILAIRLGGIGDIVLAIPALRRIRQALGADSVTLLTDTRYLELVELITDIDDAIGVDRVAMEGESWIRRGRDLIALGRDLRSRRLDLAIDLHGFPESNLLGAFSGARHRIGICRSDKVCLHACFDLESARVDPGMHLEDVYARVAGRLVGEAGTLDESPLLEVPDALRGWARQTLGPAPVVSLFVGASRRKHRWTVPGFAQVARFALDRLGATVCVLAGTTAEEQAQAEEILVSVGAGDRIRLLKDRTLSELAALISVSDLLVSNDSGPMHIGPALGVPTIGIMTTQSAVRYAPRGSHASSIDARRVADIEPTRVVQVIERVWSAKPGAAI